MLHIRVIHLWSSCAEMNSFFLLVTVFKPQRFLWVVFKADLRFLLGCCSGPSLPPPLCPPDEILSWLPNKEGLMWWQQPMDEWNKGGRQCSCSARALFIKKQTRNSHCLLGLHLGLKGGTALLTRSCSITAFTVWRRSGDFHEPLCLCLMLCLHLVNLTRLYLLKSEVWPKTGNTFF